MLSRVTLRIDNDDRIALLGAERQRQVDAGQTDRRTACAVFRQRHARRQALRRLFRAASARRTERGRHALHAHPQADARSAGERRCAPAPARSAFPAAADTPVKSLSGGEKARLLLGLATFFGPQLIILDEPTNHLDIDSRAALAEAINEFPGAVIMVSHDRYLIDACADRLWVVANRAVDRLRRRSRRLPPRGIVGDAAANACVARTSQREGSPSARKTDEAKPAAAAKDCGRRGRDRTHQRHHRQDRRGAGVARYFLARPEQGGSAQQGAQPARKALQRAEEDWLEASASLEDAGIKLNSLTADQPLALVRPLAGRCSGSGAALHRDIRPSAKR